MLKPSQFSLAENELNEAVSWYWQGDTTLGLSSQKKTKALCIPQQQNLVKYSYESD